MAFVLGTLLSLMRLSKNKLLHSIAVCYIEFIRGTPLMVQVMFVYFGVGAVIQSLPALVAGIIATALNSAQPILLKLSDQGSSLSQQVKQKQLVR